MRPVCFIIAAVILTAVSCMPGRVSRGTPEGSPPTTTPDYDPLASAADREVVPAVYPVTAAMASGGDTLVRPPAPTRTRPDSNASATPGEAYRVQVFTSSLYVEATRELAVAQELFNLPIHLDYEAPYYKVGVGDFASREEAEAMVPGIKAMGYATAWVSRVVVKIRELPLPDSSDQPILPLDSGAAPTPPTDSAARYDTGGYR